MLLNKQLHFSPSSTSLNEIEAEIGSNDGPGSHFETSIVLSIILGHLYYGRKVRSVPTHDLSALVPR